MYSKIESLIRKFSTISSKKCVWVVFLLLTTQFNIFSAGRFQAENSLEDVPESEDNDSTSTTIDPTDFERELIVADSIIEAQTTISDIVKSANDSITVKVDDEWV